MTSPPRLTPLTTSRLRRRIVPWILLVLAALTPPAAAKPHEATLAVKDGKVPLGEVSAAICRGLGVSPVRVPGGNLNVAGVRGSTFVAAVNESLGDACRVTLTPDRLVLHVDPDKLPKDCDAAKGAVRIFTAVEAPEATAAQLKFYGLHLPAPVAVGRPMVVLVHGLDSDRGAWGSLAARLTAAGYQVAYFAYPSDGPIEESAASLARHLLQFQRECPNTPVELICHSMGGLVARAYVEGPQYAGGVDRLFLCGTPNAGSTWAKYRLALEVQEHYRLWKNEPGWSPTWMITDGLGEAGDDIKPKSKFLKQLNARPRRDGVKYTILAGNQHAVRSVCADWWDCSARTLFPGRVGGWWGFRQCKAYMESEAAAERAKVSDGDGPVLLKSAQLAGVTDFVVVHADHASLCSGDVPGVWDTICDRLGK